jgi:hypothetical protein
VICRSEFLTDQNESDAVNVAGNEKSFEMSSLIYLRLFENFDTTAAKREMFAMCEMIVSEPLPQFLKG